jgi:four helix bundle protein
MPRRPAQDVRDLEVYQLAFEGAMEIFEASRAWPAVERYALTDQVRRSSRSVCANLAEAWRRRRSAAHFASKLSDADAEAAETHTWLDFAFACKYIDANTHARLADRYDHIGRMLTRMITTAPTWTRPRNT